MQTEIKNEKKKHVDVCFVTNFFILLYLISLYLSQSVFPKKSGHMSETLIAHSVHIGASFIDSMLPRWIPVWSYIWTNCKSTTIRSHPKHVQVVHYRIQSKSGRSNTLIAVSSSSTRFFPLIFANSLTTSDLNHVPCVFEYRYLLPARLIAKQDSRSSAGFVEHLSDPPLVGPAVR